MRVIFYFSILILALCFGACSVPHSPERGGSGIDVGSGGSNTQREFEEAAKEMLSRLRENPVKGIDPDLFEEKIQSTILRSPERVFLNGDELDATNYRDKEPQEIHISNTRWQVIRTVPTQRSYLVLHEYLALMELDDSTWFNLPDWHLIRLGLEPRRRAPSPGESVSDISDLNSPLFLGDRTYRDPFTGRTYVTLALESSTGFEAASEILSDLLWSSPLASEEFSHSLQSLPRKRAEYFSAQAGWKGSLVHLRAPREAVVELPEAIEVSGAAGNELFQLLLVGDGSRLSSTNSGNVVAVEGISCERPKRVSRSAVCVIVRD